MRHIIRLDNLEPLLQVHARAKSLFPGAREDGASQLRLGVIPPPQSAKLDGRLDGEAVAELRPVDGDEEDVFAGEGDDAVLDVGIRCLDPGRHGVLGSWCRHGGQKKLTQSENV